MDQETTFADIVHGRQKPDPTAYRAGWDAHQAGKHFHEGPQPFDSVEALSWRIGWNDRALAERPRGG